MAVIDGGGVGQHQSLLVSEEVELVVGEVIGPSHRTIIGIAAGRRQRQVGMDRRDRRQLLACQGQADVGMQRVLIGERSEIRADRRAIRQVDVGKGDGPAGVIGVGKVGAGELRKTVTGGRDLRNVVGAVDGDRHRQRCGDDAAVMVVDEGGVGQDQGFAGGDEVEIAVGDVIRPRHRAVMGIAGGGCQRQRRLERVLLRRRQCQRRAVGRGVDIVRERRGHRRPVGQIGIGERNHALGVIDPRIVGAEQFDKG